MVPGMAGVWVLIVAVVSHGLCQGEAPVGSVPLRAGTEIRGNLNTSSTRDGYFRMYRYSNTITAARRRNRRDLIFPGTKWCGPGDKAKNYSDLGTDVNLDMCCRDHDHCNMSIPANSTLYGLSNKTPYTRSHCDCDDTFRQCLKNIRSFTSGVVGSLFFGVSAAGCFRLAHPAKCVDRDSVNERCLEYTFNTTVSQIWQFFDSKPWSTSEERSQPTSSPSPKPTTAVRSASTSRHRVDVTMSCVTVLCLLNFSLQKLHILLLSRDKNS